MEYLICNFKDLKNVHDVLTVSEVRSEISQESPSAKDEYVLTVAVRENPVNIRSVKLSIRGEDCIKKIKKILSKTVVSLSDLEEKGIEVKIYKEFRVLVEEADYEKLSLYYMQMGSVYNDEDKSSDGIKEASEILDGIEEADKDIEDIENLPIKVGGGREKSKNKLKELKANEK